MEANQNNPRAFECLQVEQALKLARKYGLEAEVMWSAMRHYEKYHKSSPETYNLQWALETALNDWDV